VKGTVYNIATPYGLIHSLYALTDGIKHCVLFSLLQHNTTWIGADHRANRGRLGKDTEVIQLYVCPKEATMALSWASRWHSHTNCKTITTVFIFKLQITGVLETSLVTQRRNRSFYTKIFNVPLLIIKQHI